MKASVSAIRPITDAHGDLPTPGSSDAFAALRRFARGRRAPADQCELCGTEIGNEHRHLFNHESRQIACSCDACAILFCGQEGGKFLRVPLRVLRLEGFSFTELQWEAMMLPINLAFFFKRSDGATTAFYPSPAGAMESLIGLPPWQELFGGEPELCGLQTEVEALIVNRIDKEAAYFVVPIDACYRLVGLIRTNWRGLSGGVEVWKAIADFFAELQQRATTTGERSHA